MNIVPSENPIPAQEVAITSLEEFLQRIQNIIIKGGYEFLIQRRDLEKLFALHLTQAIGNSQNFLTSGLIQLREELILCGKTTKNSKENLRKGLERFFQVFTEYQLNLSKGLTTLASQIQLTKGIGDSHSQNITSTYLKISNTNTKISYNVSQINKEVEDIKTHLKTTEHTYPYQGIRDAINTAERRIHQISENVKEEILMSFDKNTKLMEDACSAIEEKLMEDACSAKTYERVW